MHALTLIKKDHEAVEALFKKFEKLGARGEKTKRRLVDQMIAALSTHAAIEEQLLYPALREKAPQSEDDVLEALEEHHVMKWTLLELERLGPEDERFDAKVTVLMENVRHHVKKEETELFKICRKALKPPELEALGNALAKAKKMAPKRPHPSSPDSPPGNIISGAIAHVLDQAKEKVQSAFGRSHNSAAAE